MTNLNIEALIEKNTPAPTEEIPAPTLDTEGLNRDVKAFLVEEVRRVYGLYIQQHSNPNSSLNGEIRAPLSFLLQRLESDE
jgi:hypothetical protein